MRDTASLETRSQMLFEHRRAVIRKEQERAKEVFLAVGPDSCETEVLAALETGETLFTSDSEVMNQLIPYVTQDLSRMGATAYEAENYLLAEYAYRLLALSDGPLNEHAKVRLAAMIRRGDLPLVHLKKYSYQDALDLLASGIKHRSVFALVNAALLYATCLEDWESACQMVARIHRADLLAASSYNCYDGEDADPMEHDNMLIHFLLIRTGRMKESFFDSWENLSEYVYETSVNAPQWLFVGPQFTSKQRFYHKGQMWNVVLTLQVGKKHYIAFADGREDEHGERLVQAKRYFPRKQADIRDGMFLMNLTEDEEDLIQWWLDVLEGVSTPELRDRCCRIPMGFE